MKHLEFLSQSESILLIAITLLLFVLAMLFGYAFFLSGTLIDRAGVNASQKRVKLIGTFILMCIGALLVIFGLYYGFKYYSAMFNSFFFVAFPYLCMVVFLIGSIYRYRKTGFQVSSLSSQFLEGKKLFWGSQLFHWGILYLFFGHLVAFLFPRTVIAWNGEPVRLLILEATAFGFALAALLGLILFIFRRLSTDRIVMVSSKMDMLVYVVLLVQIISGIGVAYFDRWGSSWFASSLTPYLWSVFAFSPRVEIAGNMPLLVQSHMVSAFFILAIIPFTRFMHFLVAPLDYIWRSYQVVTWNYNRRAIRSQKTYFPGKKPLNN
ncbi:respiratory nitrate reductase subunit gamma [Algoriphagus persicinus]|uniref:respiratory nitrate reductase subunit gamma n=1 Tax=Algoriphagus persicinus TaxID=3108754 RepID=UPI002B38F7AA|nr:respiratory nitrate reductase subunit gamma [Algoriphagus sp. E1-3-M2]MEB2785328.1 respiratory nitrate reductase subunit gamma [Algoriphagus sp. E1-3-M2]